MKIGGWFKRKEPLIGVDIGLSGIKVIELDLSSHPPRLINMAAAPLPAEVFANNLISKPDVVAEKISTLLEANRISDRRVVTAVPGPAVFTKKIKLPKLPPAELAANLELEVGNFLPHKLDAVKFDYHIIGEAARNQLDVLVVAVKDEVVGSFVEALALAGLETAVVDVDYFALQNCFELGYPEMRDKIVALVDIGARFSGINICRGGHSLFTGDIAVGGRILTDAMVGELGVSFEEAEKLKRLQKGGQPKVLKILAEKMDVAAAEINRQLSLFWNASGLEEGLDCIMLSGGGALSPGFQEILQQKTGIPCRFMDAFKGVECGSGFEPAYLQEFRARAAVAVGLGLRQPGDREKVRYD